MNKLGFSVIYSATHDKQFYITLFRDMLSAGCSAIELHTPQHEALDDPDLLDLIKQFDYRAIHSSDLRSASEDSRVLSYYIDLAARIKAAAITIHPHTMEQWGWLAAYFGNIASFENMDCFKPFGQSPEDMKKILSEYPTARWTFDINHVFTNDAALQRVGDFYTALGKPGHYHISGFRDATLPHTTLHTTHQDSIIAAITTDRPIIIESLGTNDIHLFRKEYDYVIERLSSVTPTDKK